MFYEHDPEQLEPAGLSELIEIADQLGIGLVDEKWLSESVLTINDEAQSERSLDCQI